MTYSNNMPEWEAKEFDEKGYKAMPGTIKPLTLKPCPFCGGKADFEECAAPVLKTGSSSWSVGCNESDDDERGLCFGYQSHTQFATKREAAEAWNRRASEESHRRSVRAYEEEAYEIAGDLPGIVAIGTPTFADARKRCAEIIAQAMARVDRWATERAAGIAERFFGPAHTYASENADLYRAQDDAAQSIAAAIRAAEPGER